MIPNTLSTLFKTLLGFIYREKFLCVLFSVLIAWNMKLTIAFFCGMLLTDYKNFGRTCKSLFVKCEFINQTLGERMKTFEKEEYIKPENAFLIRLDGKTFSSFTAKFKKPFDERFTNAMVKTMNDLMKFFNASSAFCCSDEITLVFPPIHGKMTEHVFSGRKNKIATLAAGKCSTLFVFNLMSEVNDDETIMKHISNSIPCFDARVMEFPRDKLIEVSNNIHWRSNGDCLCNTTSTYARFLLEQGRTFKKNSDEMIKMMLDPTYIRTESLAKITDTDCVTENGGFDFWKLPTYKVFGVFAKKVSKDFVNERNEYYTRTNVTNFELKMAPSVTVTEWLLAPKMTGDDVVSAEKNFGAKMISF